MTAPKKRGRPPKVPTSVIVELYKPEVGVTARAVGEQVGLSESQVCYILHAAGVAVRRQWGIHPRRSKGIDKMVALAAAGKTLQSIGNRFQISRERVRQLLAREGVKTCAPRGGPTKRKKRRCKLCHKWFQPVAHINLYCPGGCGHKAKRQPGAKWSGYGVIELRCTGCGQTFQRTNRMVSITAAAGSKHPYCTRECYQEHQPRRKSASNGQA